MDKLVSDRIKIMGLLCTLMVVYRHSLNYLAFFNSWDWKGVSGFVELGCSKLTQVAVPFFFVVSGYFFFQKSYYTNGVYRNMVKKKTKSLLIPFLFWNIIGGLILFIIDNKKIEQTVLDYVFQLIKSNWYPPLWYVRDLITMMILVPLYGYFFVGFSCKTNKSKLYKAISQIVVLIGLFYYWSPEDCGWISSEGIFFFCLGGIISQNKNWLSYKIPLHILIPLSCLWLYNCFFVYLYSYPYINKLNTILALLVCWNIVIYTYNDKSCILLKFSSYSFFIYVTHFYLIKTFKALLGRVFFGSDMAATITYLLLPLITVGIGIFIGGVLNRKFPTFYNIITGGR